MLASRNRGKLAELQELLAPLGWRLRALGDFTTESADEPAPTFVENALLKARHASECSGLPALADDSGLEVDALDGAPGVRSARYAGEQASDADNNARLLRALGGVPASQRAARYVCVLVVLRNAADPVPMVAQGEWSGRILEAPRGRHGFGYDPLFWVPTHDCSAAELESAAKNRLSHRARAAARLLELLRA